MQTQVQTQPKTQKTRTEAKSAKSPWVWEKDLPAMLVLGVLLFVTVYIALGMAPDRMAAPYFYAGVDDYSEYAGVKDNFYHDWDERVGALNTESMIGSAATQLQDTERVLTAFCYLVTRHVAKAMNLRLLLCFALTGMSAYAVLRVMGLRRFYAFSGGLLYGLAPYLFFRHIEHICLTAAYFVPVGILLCWWAYDDDGKYLKPGRQMLRDPRTWVTLGGAFLIANNGVGYYPFFTCFFLAVVMLLGILREAAIAGDKGRRIRRRIGVGLAQIGSILLFMVLALVPYLRQLSATGGEMLTERSYADLEIYGLKISQFLMPISSHGIALLGEIIKDYNTNMPAVNENSGAYLGIAGILGLILSVLYLLKPITAERGREKFRFCGSLIFVGVLFFTIGGGISFLFFVLKLYYLRGFNRISIFLLFLCILALMSFLQDRQDLLHAKGKLRRERIFCGVAALLVLVSAAEQIPTVGAPVSLAANRINYDSDASFVRSIESRLEEGAHVFMLPYCDFPESGPIHNMNAYHMLTGYIHSEHLCWSFGELKGSEEALWCAETTALLDDALLGPYAQSNIREATGSSGTGTPKEAGNAGSRSVSGEEEDAELTVAGGRLVVAGTEGSGWKSEQDEGSVAVRQFLKAVEEAGFTGLYIDSRAYSERELRYLLRALNRELGSATLISANRYLYFYDLR